MKKRLLHSIPVTIILLLLLCIPASAKTKSLVFGIKANEAKGADDWGYNVSIMLESSMKAGSKAPTFSCKIILPKAFLAKNNTFAIEPGIGVHTAVSQDNDFLGDARRKFQIIVSVNKKGKVSLQLHDDRTDKDTSAGKIAKIKKSGKYYVLTINNLPFDKIIDYWDDENEKNIESKFDPKKAYRYEPRISIHSWGPLAKKMSGWIYFDKIKVTASKSITVNFKVWNFEGFWADLWRKNKGYRVSKGLASLSY